MITFVAAADLHLRSREKEQKTRLCVVNPHCKLGCEAAQVFYWAGSKVEDADDGWLGGLLEMISLSEENLGGEWEDSDTFPITRIEISW